MLDDEPIKCGYGCGREQRGTAEYSAHEMAEGAGWVLEDAGSLKGTYVNRALASGPEVLVSGDEVQIGKYRFVFLLSDGPLP